MDQREQAVIMSNLPDLIVPLRSGEDEGIQYMCEARLLDTSVVSLSACKTVAGVSSPLHGYSQILWMCNSLSCCFGE